METARQETAVWDRLDGVHDALIEASAGTGKTYALTKIVLRLVRGMGYGAGEVLLVTFTEKAAGELRDRIRAALAATGGLPPDFDEMTVCTIHSFCRRLLDEYAFESGVPMRGEVADGAALARRAAGEALRSAAFAARFGAHLAGALAEAGLAGAGALAEEVARLLATSDGRARQAVRDDPAQAVVAGLLDLAEARYRERKREAAVLTFDDLVERASAVVAGTDGVDEPTRRRLIEALRRRYRVALVDEFQDTDARQWDLFRTLFASGANRVAGAKTGFLVAVGDPKQAIYAFRGADAHVYYAAREALAAGGGQRLTLTETYRARRPLVAAFNTLFGDSGWFADGAGGAGVVYEPVAYPAAGNPKFDGAGLPAVSGPPVVLLESLPPDAAPSAHAGGSFGNRERCLPVFLAGAAAEMARLHAAGLGYGAMCVLVETRAEAAAARRALSLRGLPCGQYKRTGLFDSPEAEGVLALLDFLAAPAGRGTRAALLLSPLFGVPPARLAAPDAETDRAFDGLAARLQAQAAAHDWAGAFETVMDDPRTALGHASGDRLAFNRTRAAVRQIFDALLRGGDADGGAAGLAERLRAWRRDEGAAGEGGALYERDSAADRIQVMTMHASKGLEFPVVFLAYGFSKVVKSRADAEGAAERRRLLYVAMTRAEHRLYLPWSRRAWSWTAARTTRRGGRTTAAAVAGQGLGSAGSALLASGPNGFLGRAILTYFAGREETAFDAGTPAAPPRPSPASAAPTPEASVPRRAVAALHVPFLADRRLRWDSFSSLSAHGAAARPVAPDAAVEADPSAGDGDGAAHDPAARVPTLLPRTNVSGTVFHEVMEALCKGDEAQGEAGFRRADPAALLALVRRAMRRSGLANRTAGGDSTEATLVRMVRAALDTELRIGDAAFRLRDVPHGDRLAEADFAADTAAVLGEAAAPPWGGALNGQVDLIVRRGSRVYILDWKTNSLPVYDAAHAAAAMAAAGYHLQCALYALAVARWLAGSGLTVAGAAYLFVRGGEAGGEAGVYARALDAAALESCRREVAGLRAFNNKERADGD